MHWKFSRSCTKMKSAVIFNTVQLANSVGGCFPAVSTSASGDCLLSSDDWQPRSPDQTECNFKKPEVTTFPGDPVLGGGEGGCPCQSLESENAIQKQSFCVSSTCFLCYFMPNSPGSLFALPGSSRRQCFSRVPCFTPAPASREPDALP